MRDLVTTLLEIAGGVCLVVGASYVHPALAFGVGGVLLIGLGYLLGRG